MASSVFQPHPFHWVPADGQRHASADPHPPGASIYPDGTEVTTLCGQELAAEASDTAWLWGTCPVCDVAARRRAGMPPMAGAR
ncbi:zinc-finger [Saccharopolyspora antimicrobica]|uniref:Zinc finger protein n=1 Tax=Saccharopolyspora antimicrobica TaxID=455193 RepID=A0A1I4TP98_9PSEU|nr:zinc finger protein [Saccharopolyspora antimicrobica]RKT88494.1 zinc finger protein [Saccharopolyspora antimicrobica]SFM78552.1 zinc-finger [Saccharopolyspora antimicrobica]